MAPALSSSVAATRLEEVEYEHKSRRKIITLDDLKRSNVDIYQQCSRLDALAFVCEVASVLWEEENTDRVGNGKNVEEKQTDKILDLGSGDASKQERLMREKALKRPVECDAEVEQQQPENKKTKILLRIGRTAQEEDDRTKVLGLNIKEADFPKLPTSVPPVGFTRVMKEMGSTKKPLLVIQKTLSETDMSNAQSRLSIPFSQVITTDFLNSEERTAIDMGQNLQVQLIEPMLNVSWIALRRWDMKKKNGTSSMYVLKKPWNYVRDNNNLKKGDEIQVWAFQADGRLCLALVKVAEGKVTGESSSDAKKRKQQ